MSAISGIAESFVESVETDRRVSTVQSYTLNGKTVQIDLKHTPELSMSTVSVCEDLQVQLPKSFRSTETLKYRLHKLEKTAQKLENAENNYLQDKLISLVAGATAIVALSFTGPFVIDAFFLPPLALTCGLLSASLSYYRWTRESNLREKLEKRTREFQKTLSEYQNYNNQVLPQAHQFYTQEASQKLMPLIEAKLNEAREYITTLGQPVPDPERKAFVTTYVDNCEKARVEIQKLIEFYGSLKG